MALLQDKALLIELNLKKWSGVKSDKNLSRELATNHSVDETRLTVNKKLTNSQSLKEIKKIDGLIRTDCIYSGAGYSGFCLSWDNQGTYLLPIELKDRFEKRINLGTTFSPDDFPVRDEIEGLFQFDIIKKPIPSSDDIRVNLPADEIAELKANAKASEDAKLEKITGSVVDKVRGVLTHFADKVDNGETFRDKTVEKLVELCNVLPALNLSGDSQITSVHQKCMDSFYGKGITADKVRDDKELAKELSNTAKDIVSNLDTKGGYFD